MARLSIDLTDAQHQQIKVLATLQGKTIREFALERLLSVPPLEGEGEAWAAFKSFMHSRVAAAETETISEKSFDEIWAEVKQESMQP